MARTHIPMPRDLTRLLVFAALALCSLPQAAAAQLSGRLIGTVKDEQGGTLAGARVEISSPALLGAAAPQITSDEGRLSFLRLTPGQYVLTITREGFRTVKEEVTISAGVTVKRVIVLKLEGVGQSVTVTGAVKHGGWPRSGLSTRFDASDLWSRPTRRTGSSDWLRASAGMSPTSPSSGSVTSVSTLGSGTNENASLADGTDFTSPSNGAARMEVPIDFVEELQIQSVGASAEYGNVQGAVINVITKHGSDRFLFDSSYHWQSDSLTSHGVRLLIPDSDGADSAFGRQRYDDFTAGLGGPIAHERAWFFGGYARLRDHDSQPGTDPLFPRTRAHDKGFLKLDYRLAPGLWLMQSANQDFWLRPEQPTIGRPFETTLRQHGRTSAITFGHLTHVASANTVWEVRAGQFDFVQLDDPSSGSRTTPSTTERSTRRISGGPPLIGGVDAARTTVKAALSHFRLAFLGADHEARVGAQLERGEHRSLRAAPGGVGFVTSNGQPFQAIFSEASNAGGRVVSAGLFASDAVSWANRVTATLGFRFDRSRAISQDLHKLDADNRETGEIITGHGTLYTWNLVSPRLGVALNIDTEGRTRLWGNYGRLFSMVQTGEISQLHPGVAPVTTMNFVTRDGDYTQLRSYVDGSNVELDRQIRAPQTDTFAVGVEHMLSRHFNVSASYVGKRGSRSIGWKDVGGDYEKSTVSLPDGSSIEVQKLVSNTPRLFLLTNPDDYFFDYDGVVLAFEKLESNGWQLAGSVVLSKAFGLQSSSGTTASGEQVSTVGVPPILFGRDRNDLTNAIGLLPNDRPHVFRLSGSADIPRTGFVIAANLQSFSGKPWTATTQVRLDEPQSAQQRILLEPRGSRRLPSQVLLDVRLSRTMAVGRGTRLDLLVDVLNVLNETAAEGLVSDDYFNRANFGQPNVVVDPRRVMFGVRLHLGR